MRGEIEEKVNVEEQEERVENIKENQNETEIKNENSAETKTENKKKELEQLAEKNLKKMKNEAGEFKKFISRGNVVDMAVGVIVGGAFGKIVTSLVNDIITPLIGIIIGGLDFSNLTLTIGSSKVAYGSFIQTIIDFLIIAVCIFTMVRLFEKLKHEEKKEEEPPKKSEEVQLLEEIRDLIKKQEYSKKDKDLEE